MQTEKTVRQPPNFVIGQQRQPIVFTSAGKTSVLGIRFYAYGAHPFLRLSLKELADRTADLETLLGGIVTDIAERIATLPPSAAFAEFEKFLMGQLSRVKGDVAPIKAVTRLLFQQKGAADIVSLARFANLSVRTLERRFDDAVGYSPKVLARVIRFDCVKNELMQNPALRLSDLSYRYRYFDQAHFIRDFRQFTGESPSAFTAAVTRRQIYFYK